MGFLHNLWDETLAGPAPDAGLGKLRKYNSFSASRTTAAPSHSDGDYPFPITRSITVVRRDAQRMLNVADGSPPTPSSPASSTSSSPFSPNSPRGNCKRWMRKKPTYGAFNSPEPVEKCDLYEKIVIVSSLDQ